LNCSFLQATPSVSFECQSLFNYRHSMLYNLPLCLKQSKELISFLTIWVNLDLNFARLLIIFIHKKKTYDKLFCFVFFCGFLNTHTHTNTRKKTNYLAHEKKKRDWNSTSNKQKKKREKNTQQTRSYSTLVLYLFE
jgi:hypothetical protein